MRTSKRNAHPSIVEGKEPIRPLHGRYGEALYLSDETPFLSSDYFYQNFRPVTEPLPLDLHP